MRLHSIGYQFIDSCLSCYYFHPFCVLTDGWLITTGG